MGALTAEQVKEVKAKGFLRNRGTDLFSGRVVVAGGVYSAGQLAAIVDCARQFGSGKVVFTSRLSAEIVGIPYEKIDDAIQYMEGQNLAFAFGGTGAKVRPIVACKGTTCVFGCCDTQAIAQALHEQYYLGERGQGLPHKFKIAVGGCPNSCIKPSLNDLGIEARRQKGGEVAFKLYFGGTWGHITRTGTVFSRLVKQEELSDIVEKAIIWYRNHGNPKERFGATIDRLGMESLEQALNA